MACGDERCSHSQGHITNMAAMPIYDKNLKHLLLWNQIADYHSLKHKVLEYYQVCSNDDPGMTLTYFTARSNLVPYAFVWEKGKTMDFSETSVVFDIKVGKCSQLNVYTNLYQYQRSKSFIDLRQRSLSFNFFSFETARPIEAIFFSGTERLVTLKLGTQH